jgi:hypothetical protein
VPLEGKETHRVEAVVPVEVIDLVVVLVAVGLGQGQSLQIVEVMVERAALF